MVSMHRALPYCVVGAALLLALVLPASGGPPRPRDIGADASAELHRLVGDAACSLDDQCRTMAIGTSACGGPERYLAWSTLRTEEAALRQAAAAYPSDRRATSQRGGAISTCSPLVDPGARCAASPGTPGTRHCTLRGAGSAPAPDR